MKFSIFADFHHAPGIFFNGTAKDLEFILDRALKENVDFIIHAGDFCFGTDEGNELLERYNSFPIKTYHTFGNHDSDQVSYEEMLKLYHMPDGHYYFDCKGYRIIALDTNYCRIDGEDVHYSMGNYYKYPDCREYVSQEQLGWLKETIEHAPHPCIIISHAGLERANGVRNQQEVRQIINDANKKRPNSVLLCINGHHHCDHVQILDGVCYFDLNSTSYDWLGIRHQGFPQELCEQYRNMNRCVYWQDPIHAIITLEGNTITVDGMESDFFMGVSRAVVGTDIYDAAGRIPLPRVQSFKITLG